MPKLVNSWAASALLKLAKVPGPESRGERFLKLASEARSHITEIAPREVAGALKRGAALIDVREREEYRRAHIPRAAHLARGTIELEIERRAPDPGVELIIYCGGGDRSALVAENLQRMGYTAVRSLAGGFRAWLDAGFPATRTQPLVED